MAWPPRPHKCPALPGVCWVPKAPAPGLICVGTGTGAAAAAGAGQGQDRGGSRDKSRGPTPGPRGAQGRAPRVRCEVGDDGGPAPHLPTQAFSALPALRGVLRAPGPEAASRDDKPASSRCAESPRRLGHGAEAALAGPQRLRDRPARKVGAQRVGPTRLGRSAGGSAQGAETDLGILSTFCPNGLFSVFTQKRCSFCKAKVRSLFFLKKIV